MTTDPRKAPSPGDPDFEIYQRELDRLEHRVRTEFAVGGGVAVVAGGVLLILLSFVFPHSGTGGFFAPDHPVFAVDALLNTEVFRSSTETATLPWRLFVWLSVLFGVVLSAVTMVTRRWVLAAACEWLGFITIVAGVLSIWSRQTRNAYDTAGEPAIGMVLGLVGVIVLTFGWARLVWSRTPEQLVLEQEQRQAASTTPLSYQEEILRRNERQASGEDTGAYLRFTSRAPGKISSTPDDGEADGEIAASGDSPRT